MGNFLKELGKGFIRSAVNQVGRDGGKVISNTVYGDAHSTPIRNVTHRDSGEFIYEETKEIINPEVLREMAEAEGFRPRYHRPILLYILFSLFFWFFGTVLYPFSIFAFIYLYYRGIKKLFKNTIVLTKKGYVATYTSDRRYKAGQRYTGSSLKEFEMEVPRTKVDNRPLALVCVCYLTITTLLLVATDKSWDAMQDSNKARKERIEKEHNDFYKKIDSLHNS